MDLEEIKKDPLKFIEEFFGKNNSELLKPFITSNMAIVDYKSRIFLNSRQAGKTTFSQQMYAAWIDNIREKENEFKMRFNLKSGMFLFEYFFKSKKCELTKVSSGSKWGASNKTYILEFLLRRGAKKEDVYNLEKLFFEES